MKLIVNYHSSAAAWVKNFDKAKSHNFFIYTANFGQKNIVAAQNYNFASIFSEKWDFQCQI